MIGLPAGQQVAAGERHRGRLLLRADQPLFQQGAGDPAIRIFGRQRPACRQQRRQRLLLLRRPVELAGCDLLGHALVGDGQLEPGSGRGQDDVPLGGHGAQDLLGAARRPAHAGDGRLARGGGQQDLEDAGPAALPSQARGDGVNALGGDRQPGGADFAGLHARRGEHHFAAGQLMAGQAFRGLLPVVDAHGLVELAAAQRAAPHQQAQEHRGFCAEVVERLAGVLDHPPAGLSQAELDVRLSGDAGRQEEPQASAQGSQRRFAQPARKLDVRRAEGGRRVEQLFDRLGLGDRAVLRERKHDARLVSRAEGHAHEMPRLNLAGELGRDVVVKGAVHRHIDGDFSVHAIDLERLTGPREENSRPVADDLPVIPAGVA